VSLFHERSHSRHAHRVLQSRVFVYGGITLCARTFPSSSTNYDALWLLAGSAEPAMRPHNPVYATPAGYHAYTVWPEAINLEDLMRLLVRHGLKMIFLILFSTTHHFSWNKSNTQLLEIINIFLKSTYYFSKGTCKIISFIKANKKYFSEQIKLNTF
jgi:hypothetical protein